MLQAQSHAGPSTDGPAWSSSGRHGRCSRPMTRPTGKVIWPTATTLGNLRTRNRRQGATRGVSIESTSMEPPIANGMVFHDVRFKRRRRGEHRRANGGSQRAFLAYSLT